MNHFYGESLCHTAGCVRKAYYAVRGKPICGSHSRREKLRTKLSKNPDAKKNRDRTLELAQTEVERVADANRTLGKRGQVICSKLRMMKNPEHIPGYWKVFPNNRHGTRVDGFGCATLSPMRVGPIRHGQPGLPEALNLENFHQSNKVYASEVDVNANPTEQFFQLQQAMYVDKIPHRRKEIADNKSAPLYSLWKRSDGSLQRLTYFQSRQFYCHFYEALVRDLPEFKRLQSLLDQGYNLQIVGYDAYPVTKSLEEHYCDVSRPFGHELVLYSMLMNEAPWRKWKTEEF